MATSSLVLWADSSRNTFASGWQSNLDAAAITFRQGDNIGIELHWVRQYPGAGYLMDEVEWPATGNITLALGRLDAAPASGTFTLTYDGDETDDIPANATAGELEDALNGVASILSEGGVTVSKQNTSYRVVWNNAVVAAGTVALGQNDMMPTCSVGVAVARTGTTLVRQILQLHIKQAPFAVCTEWETQDAPTATVEVKHSPGYSGDYKIWRLNIYPQPKAGSFRLSKTINGVTTWTVPISAAPGSLEIETALNKTGLTVSRIGQNEYEIYQAQVTGDVANNVTTIAADDSGLIAYEAKYGVLNLNSLDLELFLAGAKSALAYLEIEVEVDGIRETIVQKQVTVMNDLIDTDSYTLVEWGELIPADSVVRFDTSQSLTTPQKQQARDNIAALGSGDLSTIEGELTTIGTRLDALEGELSTNEKAAIHGAASPSASNVFATATDLAAKANISHTQAISTITGLQAALDGKASTSHTQAISTITGLETELSNLDTNKSNVGHSHTTSQITGLDTELLKLPTTNEKAALGASASPSASNPVVTVSATLTSPTTQANGCGFSVGGYDTVHYPNEIVVTVNGVQYAIPARTI